MTDWPRWDRDHTAELARFVLPAEAGALGPFPGRAVGSPLARLRAIYDGLVAIGIAYDHEPSGSDAHHQHIRPPHEVLGLRNPVGTCLDVTLVAAALALRAGLHPYVVVVDDHALLAVWLGDAPTPAEPGASPDLPAAPPGDHDLGAQLLQAGCAPGPARPG